MIRPALFADIPRLLELMREAHTASRYAETATLDEKLFKATLFNCIRAQGRLREGGAWVGVAMKDGVIEGFLIGMLDRFYNVAVEALALDLFFICSKRAPGAAASKLMTGFIGWAESVPGCIAIRMGAVDSITPAARAERLYRRKGFRQFGGLFERSIK